MEKVNNITIIGSGNVATQLGIELFNKGYNINGIISRNEYSGKKLANKTNSRLIPFNQNTVEYSDMVLVSLKDDSYLNLLGDINLNNKFIVHTSGSLDSNFLKNYSSKWGCLYPLQSIHKNLSTNWKKVNFFLEASSNKELDKLIDICDKLSSKYNVVNSVQRQKIHLSAVAVSNFTYRLLSTVRSYCEENKIEYQLFKNLIQISIDNTFKDDVFKLQTGPASRKDYDLIEKHIDILRENDNLKDIYELFTKQILNQHHEL